MRYLLAPLLYAAVLLSGCEKTTVPATIADGTYTGTFQRQVAGGGQVAPVSLTFSGGTWTGQSQITKYPALCSGTYSISGNTVSFKNTCIWTAEFDWSLILSQDYNLTTTGNQLEMSRSQGGYRDVYKLTKN